MAASQRALRVLLVDADEAATNRMRSTLSPRFSCETVSSGEAGLDAFTMRAFDVVVSSTLLKGMSGLELLDSIHEQSPSTRFILVGDKAAVVDVIDAGKRGASDYILRPLDVAALVRSVDRVTAELAARASPPTSPGTPRTTSPGAIVGTSEALANTLDAVERVAHSEAPVLLVGETGTGKDLLAARIHALGPRRHRPFVVVNAAGIPPKLLDSELFGHAAGAFNSATRPRRGLIAEADGGTLFLDEIADLPIELQGRLLRVIESGAIRAVGSDHERQVDVRFVAATQRDLSQAVVERSFREDLYFRLHVLSIQVPPLRARRGDLPALIDYFFAGARARNPRSPVEEIAPEAYERMVRAAWPGNVREVQAFVERLVVLGKDRSVGMPDVEPLDELTPSASRPPAPVAAGEFSSLRDMTSRYVEAVLAHTSGDKAQAAAILGIDVSTLYRWQRRGSIA